MAVAYIGLGANLPSAAGLPAATLAAAVERFASFGQVTARSRLYSTAPVGYADQPRFLNAVVEIETHLSPRELLVALLEIEREFGRERTSEIRNGPRTLDLDILLYGDSMISETGLEIPHPRLAEREFVLVPLNEIAPGARDPRSGAKVKELLETLRDNLSGDLHQTKNEVVAIENNCWRAGLDCNVAGCDDLRADTVADPDHS